jgi:hypothetical protein
MPNPNDKGLERGGTLGQEGELKEGGAQRDAQRGGQERPGQGKNVEKRDQEKQRGGMGREPNLEEKPKIQPAHEVD